ncbi:MAG: CsgG/HfaB family protein [Succinivibrio sp.]|nr:CsgG/HfaB family protein [Succinivibrio sp.]MCI7772758.1 CsgG/HfaB family protein [Succinivibrio sp.]MCI7785131.1 CsgG/HfaB family protein [Succinivibrio sp.]MDY5324963.1 CsgG/HfaB family protein [Succinivibrio sp.]
MKKILFSILFSSLLAINGCAIESHSTIETEKATQSIANRSISGSKVSLSIGQFANHSAYQNGIFSDGVDRLGSQAETILITYLQQAGCYQVLDRNNLKALEREASLKKVKQNIQGSRYVITGDIVEFGRKNVGDKQLWGILGKGKTQVAYSKVNINIVDIETSAVVFSSTGAGEYKLSSRDVLGFGSSAGYDSTLTGKVLSLSIMDAVNNLTNAIDNKIWIPE